MQIRTLLFSIALMVCAYANAQTGLLESEYFWGADPGQGNGNAMVAVDGSYDEALEPVRAQTTTLPSSGIHSFSIRVKDADGNWGSPFSTVIEILPGTVAFPDIQVSEGEYFWDADPGTGSGTPMFALDGNFDATIEAIGANISQLPSVGVHVLNMRMRDVNNNWGPLFRVAVEVLPNVVNFPDIHVAGAEYWFNIDPGAGSAMPMIASDGNFDGAFEMIKGGNIPVPVSEGVNVLWMRARDDNGGWGDAFGIVVNVDTTLAGTVGIPEPVIVSTIRVGPNPTDASTGFYVELSDGTAQMHIRMLDTKGRVVFERRYNESTRVEVPTDGLATGIYPVGIQIGDTVTWHSVVVR